MKILTKTEEPSTKVTKLGEFFTRYNIVISHNGWEKWSKP